MDSTSSQWLEILRETADAVRRAISPLLLKRGTVPLHRLKELLDDRAQAAIRNHLASRGVSACLVSEEGVETFGQGAYTITADPVDGTTNLARGLRPGMVSLSVSRHPRQDSVFAAVILDLDTGTEYVAQQDHHATCDGKPIRVSVPLRYHEGLISMDISKMADLSGVIPLITRARHIRSSGCAALSLCQVAEGVLDAHVDERGTIRATDVSAGLFILKQAGGCWAVDGSLFKDLPLHRESRARITATSCRELLQEIQGLISRPVRAPS